MCPSSKWTSCRSARFQTAILPSSDPASSRSAATLTSTHTTPGDTAAGSHDEATGSRGRNDASGESSLLTCTQPGQCVLQSAPWLLQEAAFGDEDWLRTRQQALFTPDTQLANQRREGRGQGTESGQQFRVKQRHICEKQPDQLPGYSQTTRCSSQPTHVTTQEVHAGSHQDQSVPDQSGFATVHVLGALVQVLDHTGHPADPDLTVEPLGVAWKPQSRLSLIKAHLFIFEKLFFDYQ